LSDGYAAGQIKSCSLKKLQRINKWRLPSSEQKSDAILWRPTRWKRVPNGCQQNSIHIGRSPRKLYIHWAIDGPQWMLDRCSNK